MTGVLRRIDAAVGSGLEALVVARHRQRLTKVGRLHALDAPAGGWAAGGSPPRPGNALDVLVDGEQALPAIAAAIEAARSHVWIAGWFFSPSFRLQGREGPTLRELLADAAGHADVRVLGWAGAPLPLFHPARREVRAMRDELVRGAKIACALDDRERPLHCHHEKLVLADDTAFVGGIDLTVLAGDRLDTSDHPSRGTIGWHDATSRLRGPVAGDVADHFRVRWREVTGEALSAPDSPRPAGDVQVHVVRTVPERIYRSLPNGDFGIAESYLRALRSAERLVYLENQFLWSPEIVSVLVDKLRNPPTEGFRLVVVLPAKPNNGEEDTRGELGLLAEADAGSGRFLPCTLHQVGEGSKPIYVHAKIGIVDDRWLMLGSANLNEHSLFNDTEVNVSVWDEELARTTRLRLWAEHLECDPRELEADPAEVVDRRWRPIAEEQEERRRRGEPPTRRLRFLPGISRRSARLLGPLNGFLVDG